MVGDLCVCFNAEPEPPELEEVKRISASQIEITWEPGNLATAYTVKYYPLNSQNAVKFLTANTTELVIQDLDPLLSYSISVAATNAAGMGDYSNEVTVESKCFLVKSVVYYYVPFLQYLRIVSSRYFSVDPLIVKSGQ